MAKVIQNTPDVIVEPWWVKGYSVYIGLGAGLVWWVATALLNRYVVEPFACRNFETATSCVNSVDISGGIATILVLIVATWLLIRMVQPRPIVMSLATAVLLWDLAALESGLPWGAALLWAIGLYGASYALFSLVARIPGLAVSLTVAAVAVVGIRLLLIL